MKHIICRLDVFPTQSVHRQGASRSSFQSWSGYFVDPRREGPGINRISIDDSLVKHVEVDGDEFLYYKLPKITIALIKGTAADRKGNITFDDMFMSGDALSICQAVKANREK